MGRKAGGASKGGKGGRGSRVAVDGGSGGKESEVTEDGGRGSEVPVVADGRALKRLESYHEFVGEPAVGDEIAFKLVELQVCVCACVEVCCVVEGKIGGGDLGRVAGVCM